jgi:hypothetical protein
MIYESKWWIEMERGEVGTLRLSERKLALRRASWLVCQEESRSGLLIVSCQAVSTENLSTMTMGVVREIVIAGQESKNQ